MLNLKPSEVRLTDGTHTVMVKYFDGVPCVNIAHLARLFGFTTEEFKELCGVTKTIQTNYLELDKLKGFLGKQETTAEA